MKISRSSADTSIQCPDAAPKPRSADSTIWPAHPGDPSVQPVLRKVNYALRRLAGESVQCRYRRQLALTNV
jgi:hypothetical protein